MNTLQNLHTHSTFCDGRDTPEEMIKEAIKRGFGSIGFSGHSYMTYSPSSDYGKKPDTTEKYKNEIKRLKEKYSDEIKVFLGLEVDLFHSTDLSEFDYLIGSAHYFNLNGDYVAFDRSAEVVKGVIDNHFAGSGIAYAKEYYKLLSTLPKYGNFDIIGHFDLITKHCEKVRFFDEDSREYRNAAIEAAEALQGKIPYFEVNTGAISRKNRTTPYPAPFLLKELNRLGFGAVISSDCHNKDYLDCNFTEAAELLRSCGFTEKYILTDEGVVPVKL